MNIKDKEKTIIFSILLASVTIFFSFGFFHLSKFETTDEHLWKYDRIGKYWNSLKEKNWEGTYINDKPGITVALISGIGLLSEPDPKENEKLKNISPSEAKLFEQYDYTQTEKTNFRFRLPVLIFSTLSLFAFFYLSFKAFESLYLALFTTLLISTNPILLGMSQIINPDSFFWIFGGLSALSYLALINTKKYRYLIICGILMGFALLSKYTAFILFLFFGISLLAKIVFKNPETALKTTWKNIARDSINIMIIFIISITVFSIFLPAVFVDSKYLFKGISQFLNTETLLTGLGAILFLFFLTTFKKDMAGRITKSIAKKRSLITLILTSLLSLLIVISLLNTWTGQKLAPVDHLRDLAYANEPREFSFKPLIDKRSITTLNQIQLYLMEAYPIIFSLSPLFIIIIFITNFIAIKRKISDKSALIISAVALFLLLYLFSTIHAKVVTNARYSIIIYPLLAIFGSFAIKEILTFFKADKIKHFSIASIIILFLGTTSFFVNKPFYFSYTNFLLPKEFSIHDSWGHGSYEAAQYLNSLSDPEKIIIWSNSDTVCRFFAGKCLKSRKIDLAEVEPDYFVISKRGVLKERNRFILLNNPNVNKDADYYFEEKLKNDYVWKIELNNRPENFIKIIKSE
ncbi:MAG: phospholipid carrier-dependent glycosyltransferase [Candidatus Moranbacteria bacterium]|nr:phospholipid carrier-dependent glycosyltransferase [Candidatus Moranbacteria bacterium]MDX9855885.1 phospholipid carrier-dependent glycosyltransferase [Candidatus Moranbacteria bacterium]